MKTLTAYEFTRIGCDFTTQVDVSGYDFDEVATRLESQNANKHLRGDERYKEAESIMFDHISGCSLREARNWYAFYLKNAIAYGLVSHDPSWGYYFLAAYDLYSELPEDKITRSVWILEVWQSPEDLQNTLKDFQEMGVPEDMLANYKSIVEKYSDGKWLGVEGKENYNAFCECAKNRLKFYKQEGTIQNRKFRVVKAHVPYESKYWTGYSDPEENRGVLRYLFATM